MTEESEVGEYRGIGLDDQFIPAVLEHLEQWLRQHSRASAELAEKLARELGLADSDIRVLRVAALLHEMEKLDVPPGEYGDARLTEAEEALLRRSPAVLGRLVSEGELGRILDAVVSWREHFDGSGRGGVTGDEIPLLARILSVACAFLHLTMERPGHGPLNREAGAERLGGEAGTRHDPRVVGALQTLFGERSEGGEKDEAV